MRWDSGNRHLGNSTSALTQCELILNLNVQIYDVKAQKVVFSKSVDMRGNNDVSWRRAVPYLVRDMAEKRERNPSYGQ